MSIITDALNTFLREFGSAGLTQQASFRGVPFITETESDEEFGRRLAIHDYPNSSNRYAEDTGGFADRGRRRILARAARRIRHRGRFRAIRTENPLLV